MVAEDAMSAGEQRLASWPGAALAQQRIKSRQHLLESVLDDADHAADALINQPRNAGRSVPSRLREYSGNTGDVVMHRLDEVDDAGDSGEGKAVYSTKVGTVSPKVIGHGAPL